MNYLDIIGDPPSGSSQVSVSAANPCGTLFSGDHMTVDTNRYIPQGYFNSTRVQCGLHTYFDLAPFAGRESDVLGADWSCTITVSVAAPPPPGLGGGVGGRFQAYILLPPPHNTPCQDTVGAPFDNTFFGRRNEINQYKIAPPGNLQEGNPGESLVIPLTLLCRTPQSTPANAAFRYALYGYDFWGNPPVTEANRRLSVELDGSLFWSGGVFNGYLFYTDLTMLPEVIFTVTVTEALLRVYYDGVPIPEVPPDEEEETDRTALDATLLFDGGYYLVSTAKAGGIYLERSPLPVQPLGAPYKLGGNTGSREPRLALAPYGGLMSCLWREGSGNRKGQVTENGSVLQEDDLFRIRRAYSFDYGLTWKNDPADSSAILQGENGVRHARETFSALNGERLLFYNDQSEEDENGDPTGRGKILCDVYSLNEEKLGTFPVTKPGEEPLLSDDSSFDALCFTDGSAITDCVFTVNQERVRYRSFDNGRTWVKLEA